jgi:hypothetical protein
MSIFASKNNEQSSISENKIPEIKDEAYYKDLAFPTSGTKSIVSNAKYILPPSFVSSGIYIAVFQNEVFICDSIRGLAKIIGEIPFCGTVHLFGPATNCSLRIGLKTPLQETPQFIHAPKKVIPVDEYKRDRNFICVRVCLNREENVVNIEVHKSEDSIKLLPKDVKDRSILWLLSLNDFIYVKF